MSAVNCIIRGMKLSVVIPNWNGERLLKKNLPLILKVLPRRSEVIIVDDGSQDNSVVLVETFITCLQDKQFITQNDSELAEIKKILSQVANRGLQLKLIKNRSNRGFIYSCNRGVREAKGELIVLLNNDVVPQKDFLVPALKHFQDPRVFAVSFNEQQFGWAKIWWRGGFIHHGIGGRDKKAHITAWASGGSAIFRKSIWQKLGGFDPLYHPFYWEDFDLGYRAWKAGYKIIWEPKAIVDHRHESTISKLDQSYVNLIRERNQLLFIWKNIDDFWLRLTHPLGLLLRVATGPNYLKVIWAAWRHYRRQGRPRGKEKKRTDREILNLFKT